jgi:alanyl-tRNA synthetase
VQPDQIEYAEHLANQVIWQNRQIFIRAASPEEAKELPLRKIPPVREGKLRLIEIEDFDMTACGGTHVARTGEIGMIKIVKLERSGDKLRIEFRCGQRALQDYRQKNSIVNRLMTELTTSASEIPNAISKMQSEHKEAKRLVKNQQNALLRLEAESLLRKAKNYKNTRIVTRAYPDSEYDASQLRTLATQLLKEENVICLLGAAGEKSHLIFCRTEDAPGEMNTLLKQALPALGKASGGGTAVMAQGGGPAADQERLEQVLTRAERLFIGQL